MPSSSIWRCRKIHTNGTPNIQEIIAALAGESVEERESAAKSLRDLTRRGISTEEGILALRAAAHEFPPRQYDFLDSSADLIRAAADQPRSEYVPIVVELYSTYRQGARDAALALLTRSKERAAAMAYMRLLHLYARAGGVPALHLKPLITHPRHPDVFLPEILNYADITPLAFDVYLLCLTYLQQDLVTAKEVLPYSDQIVDHYQDHERVLLAHQQSEGISWMWEETYQKSRSMGALLLDLMGYLDASKVEEILARGLIYQDPRLKCFAICSLLRHRKDVESSHVVDVARSAEMRRALYQELGKLGALLRFPEELRTQAAFAESDMVNWLTFPTEMGRAPDEIELMEVVGFDTKAEEGYLDYYLFRFRTHEPHWAAEQGWLAGVSGPFAHQKAPTVVAPSGTFSAFEPWDSMTPEEHVRSICGILDEWERKWERIDPAGVSSQNSRAHILGGERPHEGRLPWLRRHLWAKLRGLFER